MPHSPFRVTVPQNVMFGGAERDVVERGERHNVKMSVDTVEGSNDDCMARW